MQQKVYITKCSEISSLGIGESQTLSNLSKEIVPICNIDKNNKYKYPFFEIKENLNFNSNFSRSSQISLTLLSLVEDSLKNLDNIPIFLATSTGGIKETEEVYKNFEDQNFRYPLFERHFFNKTSNDIKEKYKNKFSESYTFSTACSSSGHSIIQAFKFLKKGIIKKAVILGVDTLSLTTMIGFDSLKLVSHTGTKPLSNLRNGLSLGEGGGILILETDPVDEPIAEIIGVSSNSDAYHISSPDPEGEMQKKCILDALSQAKINPSEIDYISCHGTGTPMNDEIELKAVKAIFSKGILMTSLKSFIGHTLGASAVTEISIVCSMLKNNKIYQPNDFSDPMDSDYIPVKTIDKKVKYFIKNSFGFGGNNVSMVFRLF